VKNCEHRYFVEMIENAYEETIRAYVQNQLKVMDQLESASKQINLF
jgi:REP element-mobilizing transposase RayT